MDKVTRQAVERAKWNAVERHRDNRHKGRESFCCGGHAVVKFGNKLLKKIETSFSKGKETSCLKGRETDC